VQTKLTSKKKKKKHSALLATSFFHLRGFFSQVQSGINCCNNKTSNELLLASILFEESSAIDILHPKTKISSKSAAFYSRESSFPFFNFYFYFFIFSHDVEKI
jgi:hypothetical protein